jgi:hypothetical protein
MVVTGSKLFHAIVAMGLAFGAGGCGGRAEVTGNADGGEDAHGTADATGGGVDGTVADGAGDATDSAAADGTSPEAATSPEAGDAGSDAYGYPDDAGNCVCPSGARPFPQPCCFGVAACSWPCYV